MKLTTKDDVYLLLKSTTWSAALGAAIETGLLWQLAAQPLSASEIVAGLSIPGKRGYYWLQLLEKMGILEQGQNGYRPTRLACEAILEIRSQESWEHLVLDERERSAGIHNLSTLISVPGSIWAAQELVEPENYVDKMRASPARAREFTRMLFEVHQPLAQKIAEFFDLSNARRMMDFGGGSGVVSMALLRKYPALTSTVLDIENVCQAGREIAAEQGLSDRLTYHPAEFATDDYPTGFDVVLQCDIGFFELDIFRKLYQSLAPGGRLIFVEHFSPSETTAPLTRVEWTFLDSLHEPDFGFPTLAQVQAGLAQAGFEVAPEHHRLDTGWMILQAHR